MGLAVETVIVLILYFKYRTSHRSRLNVLVWLVRFVYFAILPGISTSGNLVVKEAEMEKRKPHILIIEDDDYSREALEHLLNAEGCETQSATGGVSGYYAARRSIPDVIALDLNLPDIDGRRVLEKLRGNRALHKVPIVVITGYRPDDIPEEVSSSADVCITKPASFDDVIQAIFNLLTGAKTDLEAGLQFN